MNRLQFFKTIPLIGLGFFFRPLKLSEKINIEIRNLPGTINKTITFIKNGVSYELFITDNILIQNPDGTYSPNVYKDLCKVCGRAYTINQEQEFKRSKSNWKVKAEGSTFKKSKFNELVGIEANKVFEELQRKIT